MTNVHNLQSSRTVLFKKTVIINLISKFSLQDSGISAYLSLTSQLPNPLKLLLPTSSAKIFFIKGAKNWVLKLLN